MNAPDLDIEKKPANPSQWNELSLFCRQCFGVTALGVTLTFLFTFLPWTRFMGGSFAGFQSPDSPWVSSLYSGFAGKVNLGACGVLFFFLLLFLQARNVSNLRTFAIVALLWTVPFAVWLVILYVQLDIIYVEGGILLTIIAAGSTAISSFTLLFLLRRIK